MTPRFLLDALQCPRCGTGAIHTQDEQLQCIGCGEYYGVRDGIPQLLKDPSLFTQLEAIDYDQHHNIDETRREKVARDWQAVFAQHGVQGGDVLEIGSGTGQLTWGLAHRFPFRSVSACDISTRFLLQAANVVGEQPPVPVHYYACDANHLPFADHSFDLVVGHSVLHHFIDYDKIIHRLGTLLRPGGMAIFYEPVLQGKMLVAFMADLMLRTDNNTGWGILDNTDRDNIKRMKRHIMKAKWIGDQRERLEKIEDKYVFDIHAMRRLALAAGFSRLEHSNLPMPEKGYKHFFDQHLLMEGIPGHKIQKFAFIPAAFTDTLASMLPEDIATPMGYFAFCR